MEEWVHVQMGGAPRAHDAVQRWVQGVQQEIAGRVVLRGCPWEEGGRRRRGAAQMMWGLKRPPARRPELDHATKSRNAAQAQTMTLIPAAQLKIQKSATSHEFSKQTILLTFSSSKKLYCCWIGEAMTWPIFPAGSSIQQRSWHSSNRNSSKTKCYLHALHFS